MTKNSFLPYKGLSNKVRRGSDLLLGNLRKHGALERIPNFFEFQDNSVPLSLSCCIPLALSISSLLFSASVISLSPSLSLSLCIH